MREASARRPKIVRPRNANGPPPGRQGERADKARDETNADVDGITFQNGTQSRNIVARLGWPIIPLWWTEAGRCGCGAADCRTPGKHPLGLVVRRGILDATTEPATIAGWWQRFPRANVAVATGPASGIVVLDIDGPDGEASLVALERRHGPLPETYPMQWTGGGRGGWQGFFQYPAGRTIRTTAGRIGHKIDVRAAGGSALIPPSSTVEDYRWAGDRLPLEPLPPAWIALLDPPAPQPKPWRPGDHRAHGSRYVLRALESELAMVAVAPPGRRNEQLNRSAHALFRFAGNGELDPKIVADALTHAGRHAGLSGPEIASTLASAARARGLPWATK